MINKVGELPIAGDWEAAASSSPIVEHPISVLS
jgi:hypothetical protein